MTRARGVSLSDRQLKLVQEHAAALPVQLRDRYLREIADRLCEEPSDAAVVEAINIALDRCHAFNTGNNNTNLRRTANGQAPQV